MAIPSHVKYLIIGAGIHGLSTAYHLAQKLKASGKGDGRDILVVDKGGIAAGASGIACGVVRNNYFQPAMRELMAHSVGVWETDPEGYSYHPVGYMQISPESMHEDVASIARQQKEIGYESTFIEGEKESMDYMKTLFHDWQAKGITSVLHEKRGGYANNTKAMYALATKAENEGVRILTGCAVTGFKSDSAGGAIQAVETDKGEIGCDQVVIGAGPWAKTIWDMLELPKTISIRGADGTQHDNVPMWIYWSLQEGTLGVDPELQKTNDGKFPPVIHVDSNEPLYSDYDGSLITDKMWGIYYKPDFHFRRYPGRRGPLYTVDRDPMMLPSTLTVSIPPILSSVRISRTCGPRPWRIARSASKASSSFTRTSPRVALALSHPTVSRCSMYFVKTVTWWPIPTTATRCWASASWWRKSSAVRRARCSSRSASRVTPKASCTRYRTAPFPGADMVFFALRGVNGRPGMLASA